VADGLEGWEVWVSRACLGRESCIVLAFAHGIGEDLQKGMV
jgi:hypothetical protein